MCALHITVRSARSIALFFLNATAPPEIYTLSLHDALPISRADLRPARPDERQPLRRGGRHRGRPVAWDAARGDDRALVRDRKSTRLNSSHRTISYAVFCLKKKKNKHSRVSTLEKHSSSINN